MDKLYIVKSQKTIIGMHDIMGPLTTPSKMKFSNVLEMVRKGYDIYQVNPYNTTEMVKVTISNINDINFSISRSTAASQKKLNREFQEMDKPIIVDVVSKENKPINNTKENKEDQKNKQNDNKKSSDTNEKISKPDDFTK